MSLLPVNIQTKEDHPDKVAELATTDTKYYIAANEFNRVTGALDELNHYVKTLNYTVDQATATLTISDNDDNVIATLSLGFLNNEGTSFSYNAETHKLELRNDAGELLSEIPVAAFVTGIVTTAAFNGVTPSSLEFKDAANNVLFTVPFAMTNIEGLPVALQHRVPYTGANDNTDLGNFGLAARYLRANNKSVPAAGTTFSIFGVYQGEDLTAANRSLYVYVDENGKQHVNNRGSGGGASFAYTNSVFGVLACNSNETGVNIVAYGYGAANATKIANNIVAVGAFAGSKSTESDQIFVGPFAGEFIESGTYNVIVCRGSRNISDEPKYVNKSTILGARIIYTPDEVANGLNQVVLITDGFGNRVFEANTISKSVKVMGRSPLLNLIMDTTDSSALTGTTTETVLKTFNIPANETANGALDLQAYCAATGTAGTKTLKVYRNTTNNFSTATLIATLNIANTIALSPVDRKFMIKGGNTLYGLTSGFNAAAPGASGAAALSIGYNPADAQYIFVTGQLANTADSMTLKHFELNFKRQL